MEDAQETISFYFKTFSRLKKWLEEQKNFIQANGYCFSVFGRKRRLPNVFSVDKGIASHEVRSGINFQIQSVASDINLLGAIDAQAAFDRAGLDAKIFMLVHDSIVVLVKDEDVAQAQKLLQVETQKERGCSIPGCPVGVDQDVHQDYSVGKFEEYYEVAQDAVGRHKLARISSGQG